MPVRQQSRRAFLSMSAGAALAACVSTPPMRYDLVVKGGRVIDPARDMDDAFDVAIANGRIVSVSRNIAPGDARILDASGKLVVPGLIDIHTHGTMTPESPGLMLADGVTGWIEAGWQGADTVESGIAAVRASPQKAGILLNIGRRGVTIGASEVADMSLVDAAAARAEIAAHRDVVVGVKARLSRGLTGAHDVEILRRAIAATEGLNVPVMIHMGDSYSPLGTLLDMLRPGDIVTHMYSPPPHTIVDATGNIIPEAIAARARGVIFDWGQGTREHVLWSIAEQALAQGFAPDTASSDWTTFGQEAGVVQMPVVMSNLISLGIPLKDVVAMATCNAAQAFPLFEGRGTLAPGAPADVAVMELQEGAFELLDTQGNKRPATQMLFTRATVLGGQVTA